MSARRRKVRRLPGHQGVWCLQESGVPGLSWTMVSDWVWETYARLGLEDFCVLS